MSHLHRFYHQTDTPTESSVALSREESHHAMRVLRVRTGDPVELFDGRGHTWAGAIQEVSRNEVWVVLDNIQFEPRPTPTVTLAQAWLHREKLLDDLVRQATVLGVNHIRFYRADRSEKKPRPSDKWTRIAIEACKQCGRRWLPEFSVAESLTQLLTDTTDSCVVMAAMEGPHEPLNQIRGRGNLTYLVGPEGDFSEAEIAQAREAGAIQISLGSCTFRSEMAAQVGLTLIQHHLGHLGDP